MKPLKSLDALNNFITTVVLCAPDKFPIRDYLPPEGQMCLHKAIDQLRDGITLAFPQPNCAAKREILNSLLNASLACYLAHNSVEGAALLEDFRDSIFGRAK